MSSSAEIFFNLQKGYPGDTTRFVLDFVTISWHLVAVGSILSCYWIDVVWDTPAYNRFTLLCGSVNDGSCKWRTKEESSRQACEDGVYLFGTTHLFLSSLFPEAAGKCKGTSAQMWNLWTKSCNTPFSAWTLYCNLFWRTVCYYAQEWTVARNREYSVDKPYWTCSRASYGIRFLQKHTQDREPKQNSSHCINLA